MLVKMILLGIWMILVPFGMGFFVLDLGSRKNGKVIIEGKSAGFAFCSGYILMWAVFQLVSVPFILKKISFPYVVYTFEAICLSVALAGAGFFWLHLVKPGISGWKESRKGRKNKAGINKKGINKEGLAVYALWCFFLAGLLFQMYQAYHFAYADGDDAFYIPISTSANLGESMYQVIPYTGYTTELNVRYGLAPFPIWVSFIAAKCGVNVAVAAHSLMPPILIMLTYVIYLETGRLLCAGKKKLLPVFMIFVSLLQIFGNYSIYPASTFLLTRSRQGKAALGNVILPFFILLLLKIAEEVKEQGKAGWQNVLWMFMAMTAGCLCSTMSGFLCCMLVMMSAFLLCLLYRKPWILCQGLLACLPGVAYALLYIRLK